MTRNPGRDFMVGLFVMAGLAALAYLSFNVGGLNYHGPGGLVLYASFDEIGGLKTRAPVVIAGVKVGQVDAIALDDQFRARTTLNLDPSLELPVDSSVSIVTAGLLGDRYLSIQVGAEPATLRSGEEFSFTESAVLLERLIGKLIYSRNNNNGS